MWSVPKAPVDIDKESRRKDLKPKCHHQEHGAWLPVCWRRAGGGHWKVPTGKLARSPLGFRPVPSHLTVRWGWTGRVLESFCEYRALHYYHLWALGTLLMCLSFLSCKHGIILVLPCRSHVLHPHFTTISTRPLCLLDPQTPGRPGLSALGCMTPSPSRPSSRAHRTAAT